MQWLRLRALIIKELLQVVRDPSSILISFVLPAILLFIYGYGISLDYEHLRIGLVLEDSSQIAQNVAETLTGSPYFSVEIAKDRIDLEKKLVKGSIRGIAVVPSYFSKRSIPPMQIITDGSEPNTAHFVQNYIQGALANSGQLSSPRVVLDPRYWFNEELKSRNVLVPGSIAMIMTLIGTLLTALVVAREWERGTMEALMATPVSISELILGKCISYFLLGILSFLFSVGIALFFFQVPLRGSFFLLIFTTTIFLLIALGMGLLISTLLKNQFAASQAALVSAFLPAFMLSGFIFEITSMPWPIQLLTYFLPAKYYVCCLQTIFLAGNVWSLIAYNLCAMGVIGIFLFLYVAHRTTKRLE